MEKLHYLSQGADFVVLAGSLPRKVPTSFYADAVRDLARRDVRVVLDSEGEALRARRPGGPVPRLAESARGRAARRPGARGRRRLPHGARRHRRDGCAQRSHHARERLLRAARARPEDESVPCLRAPRRACLDCRLGRRPLAQFLAGVVADLRSDEAFRLAVAAGSASVLELGAGSFDPHLAATYPADIELSELQLARS